MLSFISCLYISCHLWVTTGGGIVVDKYINKHLQLLTTISHIHICYKPFIYCLKVLYDHFFNICGNLINYIVTYTLRRAKVTLQII